MSLTNIPRVQKARIAGVLKDWPASRALKFSLACRFATALGLAHGTDDRVRFLEHVMGTPPRDGGAAWLSEMVDRYGHGGI